MIDKIIGFVMSLDENLGIIIQNYGVFSYVLLFLIIFFETGIVITPFLPGDSLLFAAGAFASKGAFNIWLLSFLLIFAAIIGDNVNYHIGKFLGKKALKLRFIRKKHLEKTEKFYEKYGNKTIVLARFVPIVRTIAPFVAGVGRMNYRKFLMYNIIGGVIWVFLFLFSGYYFGNIPFVKRNFELVILAIIIISIIPVIKEFIKTKKAKS